MFSDQLVTLATDASQYAWGAYLQSATKILESSDLARGLFNLDQQLLGSTLREFDGLLGALGALALYLTRKFIGFLTDKTGVVGAIANNFSQVEQVPARVMKLNSKLLQLEASLVAEHVPGTENTADDSISRVNMGDAYQITPWIF